MLGSEEKGQKKNPTFIKFTLYWGKENDDKNRYEQCIQCILCQTVIAGGRGAWVCIVYLCVFLCAHAYFK